MRMGTVLEGLGVLVSSISHSDLLNRKMLFSSISTCIFKCTFGIDIKVKIKVGLSDFCLRPFN